MLNLTSIKLLVLLLFTTALQAQLSSEEKDSIQALITEIEDALRYTTEDVHFSNCHAKLTVPEGFRFLEKEQSMYVLTELWGNAVDSTILGMLVPDSVGILQDNSWVFTLHYHPIDWVDLDQSKQIDANILMSTQQKTFKEMNQHRLQSDLPSVKLLGWVQEPNIDYISHQSIWAKKMRFGDEIYETINFIIYTFGRKGALKLNAVASMPELEQVQSAIPLVKNNIDFEAGFTYDDFNAERDRLSLWNIEGLILGELPSSSTGTFFNTSKIKWVVLIGIAIFVILAARRRTRRI